MTRTRSWRGKCAVPRVEPSTPRAFLAPIASVNGFSLHATAAIPAHRRDQLERLMRYTARGAVSLERLEQDANGDLIYRFNLKYLYAPAGKAALDGEACSAFVPRQLEGWDTLERAAEQEGLI